jgi:hypothetical protein
MEVIREDFPDILMADGYDDCIVGLLGGCGREYVLCYDAAKIIEKLSRDMSVEDAREFFAFNIFGAYAGPKTPMFLHRLSTPEEPKKKSKRTKRAKK